MVQENSIKLLVILGATGVGKSDKAIECALKLNGEVIGCDSMQIYKGMDIGTGKISESEMRGVPHYMIDVVNPDVAYSAGDYCNDVKPIIKDIASRGKLPIICGGTGLYALSLLKGATFGNRRNDGLRNALKSDVAVLGKSTVYNLLARFDKASADKISQNDIKRTVRALEILYGDGKPKSESVSFSGSEYDYRLFVLTRERSVLYDRINARVRKMYDSGLIDEVMSLSKFRDCQSMQAIGYKEILENPDMQKEDLINLTAQKSRNYAKRQITFFKNMDCDKIFTDADADIAKLYTESL